MLPKRGSKFYIFAHNYEKWVYNTQIIQISKKERSKFYIFFNKQEAKFYSRLKKGV